MPQDAEEEQSESRGKSDAWRTGRVLSNFREQGSARRRGFAASCATAFAGN